MTPPPPADRVPEGSVGRRGRLDSQEPLEPLEDGDYLEMTDPKETQYDTDQSQSQSQSSQFSLCF